MKQNIYDDPGFFAKYSQMSRSTVGLEAAGEWETFKGLLPELDGIRVLDLGCGFGWHCRYAAEQGASAVVGVDISEMMLEKAREATSDKRIEYQKAAIEDIQLPAGSFDLTMSSLAFHYIENFRMVCDKVYDLLKPGGGFIFSIEHPMFTSREQQDWYYGAEQEKLHWPVDRYQDEGIRRTSWLADDVVKYHRTFANYLNSLIEAGFRIEKVLEPEPPQEMLQKHPEFKDESRRPMFLLISARK